LRLVYPYRDMSNGPYGDVKRKEAEQPMKLREKIAAFLFAMIAAANFKKLKRDFRRDVHAVVDLGVVLMIGIAFAALMIIAYIIFTLKSQLLSATNDTEAKSVIANITGNFNNAVSLIMIAITVFILALAISALLLLRGRK